MQRLRSERPLVVEGDRLLLPLSLGLLLASSLIPARIIFHWPRVVQLFGIIGLIYSPVFLVLSCWEIIRYQRGWRTLLAALICLAATAIGWGIPVLQGTGTLR
ncbi:MAG: hypothetical protein KGS61_02110 [Verrucomicrobia bacterium]|nr:hypothetical protein [Verrucomicrobiota bacterium]